MLAAKNDNLLGTILFIAIIVIIFAITIWQQEARRRRWERSVRQKVRWEEDERRRLACSLCSRDANPATTKFCPECGRSLR